MKTSLNWLRNYIDLSWTPAELAERLTLAGLEVEGVETTGGIPAGVVVAEILSRAKHPNADKLSVCQVSTGAGEPLQIVCGAPNCDAGAKVPLATVGTALGPDFVIKPAKLRGVESQGMLCSAKELGLGADHGGLLHLPAETALGRPLAELYPADTVIDWEITPNRPDWASHLGIAREIAAVADRAADWRLPAIPAVAVATGQRAADLAAVEVRAADLCPRYTARLIRGVKIGPSPAWLQDALRSVGLRPINNVVDITNYVMMECGQPLHAFDFAKLGGGRIVVRRAAAGEKLTTLDGTVCELTTDNLLIADAERGVALAGVMGGQNSEIGDDTTTVLLESAAFQPSNIRRTAKTLGFHTDSSYRFERGVGLEMVDFASRRAAALICECAGGELLDGVIDAYPRPYRPHRVACRVARVNQLLGTALDGAAIAALLARLGLAVVAADAVEVAVEVPSFRLDLEREVDLIEEVARMHGLDQLPARPTLAKVGGPRSADAYYPIEAARAQLLGLGLSEAMNYTLLNVKDATTGTGVEAGELLCLANPISAENCCLRPSLLPGLLRTVGNNLAHQVADLAMFEIGRVIVNRADQPEERYQVGIVLTGRRHPERFGAEKAAAVDFYDLKGLLEGWLAARGVAADCVPSEHPAFKSGTAAALVAGETELAVFGEVDATLTKGLRLAHPLYLALVELERLHAVDTLPVKFTPLPQFPSTSRDISLVAPRSIASAAIVAAIRSFDCPLLERVELFDLYDDEAVLGQGNRSLAYSLTYRDSKQTLTDDRATAAHERLKTQLAAKLPISYR